MIEVNGKEIYTDLAEIVDPRHTALVLVEGRSDSPAQVRFNLRMHAAARRGGPPLTYTVPGTPGHEFVRELDRKSVV